MHKKDNALRCLILVLMFEQISGPKKENLFCLVFAFCRGIPNAI